MEVWSFSNPFVFVSCSKRRSETRINASKSLGKGTAAVHGVFVFISVVIVVMVVLVVIVVMVAVKSKITIAF
jgi:hypothetical protein